MKNLLLFILLLASKLLSACGYYPYAEDTRMSLFNPAIFGYSTYSNFYYSANQFSSEGDYNAKELSLSNTKLWFAYCAGKVTIPAIDIAVYQLSEADVNEHSQNEMIQYLYQQKDVDALNYLRFAKRCEFFNSWQEDPWERSTFLAMPKRTELMNRAIDCAHKVQNKELKKRYTFLAIRLAWYNHHFDNIQSLFAATFEKTSNKDLLYHWSLYFKSFTETDSALANFELAQVFANAVDKRFVCHQYYHSNVALERALQFAHTKEEKANVYLLYGIERPDKSLPYLQKIYALNPSAEGLSFLVLREINKLEDFVFTPYYTLFEPSVSNEMWDGDSQTSTRETLNRSERDRLYAKDVLQFVNSVNLRSVENPLFWQCCKAYLQFMTRDYAACLTLLHQLETTTTDQRILNQLHIIKALALTAAQAKGSAVILTEIQAPLMANQKNERFLFAIAKELEYLGNTTDAALLCAKLDKLWDEDAAVYWKTIKNKKYTYNDYFADYFNYADVVYTPEQVQSLINDIQNNQDRADSFSVFKYEALNSDLPRLYDLLGTKYIRQNKLENAAAVFKKIEPLYWMNTYSAWSDHYNIFEQSPFYRLKYTPEFIPSKEPFRLNKYSITRQLISYLAKAENINEKDRDYYYFLVANAYYNMGREGNVSMMRRMGDWSGVYLSVIEDEAEFRQSNLAKKYYLLAKQNAKTDQFKALCLRMIIRCEKNNLSYRYYEDEHNSGWDFDSLLATNQYRQELQTKYPDYYDDLVSSCENFDLYFKARR